MTEPLTKTCDYCGTSGVMPTFMDGETICYDCLRDLPKTTRDGRREVVKLRAMRSALIEEVERLRGLLTARADDHSHKCIACHFSYTPGDSDSEDCPACGCDGTPEWMPNGREHKGD